MVNRGFVKCRFVSKRFGVVTARVQESGKGAVKPGSRRKDRWNANSKITGLIAGEDGVLRCAWPGSDELYRHYHDQEWGRPVADDIRLFEKICLEGFQSGLSWLTILRKRENFREAFDGFDFDRVARFTEKDVERLLQNAGIIRHRGKIVSTINNAKRARELVDEAGSLAAWFWKFEPQPHRAAEAARPRCADGHAEDRDLHADLQGIEEARLDALSARPRSTPSCRRWAWSTTTSRAASAARPVEKERKKFKRPG